MAQKVGIDAISFYTPGAFLDLAVLAKARGVEEAKYKVGLGQDKMGIISPSEDIVTMGLEAAYDIVQGQQSAIDLVLFATESGFDFSKAAGIYLHPLLGLNAQCRVLEVKQACYAATGALQLAVQYVSLNPQKKALVISSDIAWYGFKTPGEVTQGAGAIAMIIAANPKVAVVQPGQFYTESIPDFYRPLGSEVPVVDGKLSIRTYRDIFKKVMPNKPYEYICFHQPFATMANKANEVLPYPVAEEFLTESKILGSIVGNIYNGSLFLSLLSVFMHAKKTLRGKTIGMFSYGSGSIGEFFDVTVQNDHEKAIPFSRIRQVLDDRRALSFGEYERWMNEFSTKERQLNYAVDASYISPKQRFYLKSIEQGHRLYVKR